MNKPLATLDAIFTADEVASRLRTTKRHVIKVARNIGACSIFGREYRLSEKDAHDIWHAMRVLPVRHNNPSLDILSVSASQRLREVALNRHEERQARKRAAKPEKTKRQLADERRARVKARSQSDGRGAD